MKHLLNNWSIKWSSELNTDNKLNKQTTEVKLQMERCVTIVMVRQHMILKEDRFSQRLLQIP